MRLTVLPQSRSGLLARWNVFNSKGTSLDSVDMLCLNILAIKKNQDRDVHLVALRDLATTDNQDQQNEFQCQPHHQISINYKVNLVKR